MLEDMAERIAICAESGDVSEERMVEIAACEAGLPETLECTCGAGHRPRLV